MSPLGLNLARLHSFIAIVQLVSAWNTFTVPHSPGKDDTPAILAALPDFTTNSTILFQEGVTYNIFTPITFPTLNNVDIRIEGNLTYPTDIGAIQAIVGDSSFPGHWFAFSGGNNVTLRGSRNPNWGWVDGHGQAWWDAQQQVNRPHGWAFRNINTGVIRDMKLWKPIAWSFSTDGSNNIYVFDNKIVALSDTKSFPFNTDGFFAGGTNMLFENNFIQNGDDCLTVGNNAQNIQFKNSYCEGGHGLSIGSLGKGGAVADVQNVLIENVIIIMILSTAQGLKVGHEVMDWHASVPFPIYITQNYWDQATGPRPNSSSTNNTHIQDFVFQSFTGVVKDVPYVEGSCISDPCWYAVPGATGKEVAIFDLYPNTAVNVVAKGIFATTETHSRVAVMCNSTAISTDVGFKCWDGPFMRTKAGYDYIMNSLLYPHKAAYHR